MFNFDPYSPKTLEYTETPNGKLRGFKLHGIYTFLGVPYGECKRWQTATPVKPWKGIRNAVQFGNRAWPAAIANQKADGAAPVFTPWDSCGIAHEAYNYNEDCLNLNVWSPTLDKNAKKPVMVWIHGGGYASGSSMEMQCHYGENLSRFGDVVVVTVNHRLNIFGFLDASRFGEKYANSGNAGMTDLVLALQWVRDNIASFGGDPDNVLIYGQSGGGGKVRCLLQAPAAAGLFHKAVVMSGAGRMGDESSASSDAMLEALMDEFHTDSIEVLEALEPEELLEAVGKVTAERGLDKFGIMTWHPIVNEWYPGPAEVVGVSEHSKNIPVMVGTVIAENPTMRVFNKHDYTEEQQIAIVREAYPDQDVDHLIEVFKKAWPGKCLTDAIEVKGRGSRTGTINFLDVRAKEATAPTYSYQLAHEYPQEGGRLAWHCADIPMVFHNSADYPEKFHKGLLEGLEDAFCASWVNMARYGNPSNEYLNIDWPAYKTGECATMVFDTPCEVRYDFDRELWELFDTMTIKVNDKYTKFSQVVN